MMEIRPEGYVGVGDNVLDCLIKAKDILQDNGLQDQVGEMVSNTMKAKSYENALSIINTYVKILDEDYINGSFS
jgi:hypothetical protein